MDWQDIEKRLISHLGPNYHNYPKCSEWIIKVMVYVEKRRKAKLLGEKNVK